MSTKRPLTAPFPKSFLWGSADAATQCEGAAEIDGKGPSIWDAFAASPGKTYAGHTPAVCCDHYHHYPEDIGLMRHIGLQAHRFSIAWPRVLPEGTGAVNAKGLDFYDRYVDALLAAGIQPFVTLYHWDLPLALHLRGGWQNRDIASWFSDYAGTVAAKLGDRVTHWMTLNETLNFIGFGYGNGNHAPGYRLGAAELLRIYHHVHLAHGLGAKAIRASSPRPALIGQAFCNHPVVPKTDAPADIAAAKAAMFDDDGNAGIWSKGWETEPPMLGCYPEHALDANRALMPAGFEADLPNIGGECDFYGWNYYSDWSVMGKEPVDCAMNALRWPITPEAFYWGLRFIKERYNKPVFITENGYAGFDTASLDGAVHDPQRSDYLRRHLIQLHRAIADGVDVRGYMFWSLMDTFEWNDGYAPKFGLIHVDFKTLKRTLKDSAHDYAAIIKAHAVV